MEDAQPQPDLNLVRPRPAGWGGDQLLSGYRPRSMLALTEHPVASAKFPCVDVHTHLGRWLSPDGSWVVPDVDALLAHMDACNVRALVNLDGLWGEELEANLERYDRRHPGRFLTLCHLDRSVLREPSFDHQLVRSLESAAAAGAQGLKIWKDLGLALRDVKGRHLLPDDERLHDLWAAAGELGLPVLIHTGDPQAFFQPLDGYNERLEELLAHPEWHLADPDLPPLPRLLEALETVVATHPRTTFVGAHVGCYSENLDWVHAMLFKYSNFHVDIAARIAELGRQPRAARRLLAAHPDRVLFGTDILPLALADYRIYFRFLETADEYFAYSTDEVPLQGRWMISALALGDELLQAVYSGNALRLFPQLESATG